MKNTRLIQVKRAASCGVVALFATTAVVQAAPAKKPMAKKTMAKKPMAKPNANLMPLKLQLPRPTFIGTPKNIPADFKGERPTGKPRPMFYVPKGTTNLALNKTVTASDDAPIIGENAQVTDGNKEAGDGNYIEYGFGKQHVQIDLGKSANIYAILMWHTHSEAVVYRDVVVQIADDADFVEGVKTIFNNDSDNSSGLGKGNDKEYFELAQGKLIPVKNTKGRYIRFTSNGSTGGSENRYTEIEVYGK